MTTVNSLGSERVAVAAVISPGALGVGATNTGWIDLALYTRLLAVLSLGVLGSGGTVDARWQQADDASGLNTVDSAQNALITIPKSTGDNKQALMNFDTGRAKPFTKRFARLVVTIGGGASQVGVTVLGFDPRHGPATDNDAVSVVQIA